MAGEGKEVGSELVEVDWTMRRQLRGIDEDEGAAVVRQPGDVRDRGHLTRDVRGTGDRDERERVAGAFGRLERMGHRLEEVGARLR